jgi:hypothetical protein
MKITPPPVKFELHAYGEVYDVSNSLNDWRELEVILSRKDTSGVYREVSFPFKFVLEAYDIVKSIFDEYIHRSKADMYVYQRNNDWTYGEPYIFNLDFTTYQQSDTVIEINSRRSDLYEFLKSKESINYEIPVSEVKESLQWNNERIMVDNSLTMLISSDVPEESLPYNKNIHKKTIGIADQNSEILIKNKLEEQDVGENIDADTDKWFLRPYNKNQIYVKIEYTINAKVRVRGLDPNGSNTLELGIFKSTEDNETMISGYSNTANSSYNHLDINNQTKTINLLLSSNDSLYFLLKLKEGLTATDVWMEHEINGTIKISYLASGESINIDTISPKILLQNLVNKITETSTGYTSDIESFNTNLNDLTMILAAESIRGFENAKLYTSYKNFKEWMFTQGYEPYIDGNNLTFKKRNTVFNKNIIAIELQEKECADLRVSINDDYIYSGVKIGYKKKDYEDTNGRFEFNGLHEYSTDLKGKDNILEIISPFRADCYGIEFLCIERGKDTTDDKSDKDIFLVNVKKNAANYTTIFVNISANDIPAEILATIFNAKLNPFNLLKLNGGLIGVSANSLKFTASDANSEVVIESEAINSDLVIPDDVKLFSPVEYDIASGDVQNLPSGENINGIVRFHYKGEVKEGFIKEISKNYSWETETQWTLFKL